MKLLAQVAKDVAMQVVAANPLFLDKNAVDQETFRKRKRNI